MSKFELSESPTLENASSIIEDGMKIKTTPKTITGKTSVLKIMLNSTPFYHFVNKEFDSELATRDQDVVIDGKRFYMGLKNNSMHTRLRLASV
ncbi:hypothetical protein N9Z41_01025 [bacterium]|nr:hypothetical protein [bacterium]